MGRLPIFQGYAARSSGFSGLGPCGRPGAWATSIIMVMPASPRAILIMEHLTLTGMARLVARLVIIHLVHHIYNVLYIPSLCGKIA